MLTDDMKIAQWGMSANAMRLQVIAQNIANANTPGYKRQKVDFRHMVDDQMGGDDMGIGDPQPAPLPPSGPDWDLGVQFSRSNFAFDQLWSGESKPVTPMWAKGGKEIPFSAAVVTDPGAMRIDGNGVSVEAEIAEMGKATGQYNLLATRISGDFKILTQIIQAR